MQAYRIETVVPDSGELQLKRLPFRPGEKVEIIVIGLDAPKIDKNEHPLKNTVLKYEDPTEPVAEDDWAASR